MVKGYEVILQSPEINDTLTCYGSDIKGLIAAALDAIADLTKIPGAEKDTGGYLAIRHRRDGDMLFLARLGPFPRAQTTDGLTPHLENSKRLFEKANLLSSWEPPGDKTGGAITTDQLIVSMSGMSWMSNEAVALMTAFNCNIIDADMTRRIASISGNTTFQALDAQVIA